jgi:hypothetical protein
MNTDNTKAECGVWLPKSDVQSPESKAQSPEGEIEAEIRLNPSKSDLIRPKKIMKSEDSELWRGGPAGPPYYRDAPRGLDFGLFPRAAGVSFLQPL